MKYSWNQINKQIWKTLFQPINQTVKMCNFKSFKHTHTEDYFLAVTVTPSDFQLTERLQSPKRVAALVLIRLFAFYNLGRRKFPCLLSLSTGDRSLLWSQQVTRALMGVHVHDCRVQRGMCKGWHVSMLDGSKRNKRAKNYRKCMMGQQTVNVSSSLWLTKGRRPPG